MSARRWWAWPLVPLYAAGLAAKEALRGWGVLRTRSLRWPVVSVGSLSAGGAGKTPVVMELVRLLAGGGWTVDVLSRGYGRSGTVAARVMPAAAGATKLFGDEPVLIAERTGAAVFVASRRYEAGVLAESASDGAGLRRVHLLDDGFQHRALARAVDLVLVTAEDLDEALLPAGNRREPLSALARADAMVVREEESEGLIPRLRSLIGAGTPIFRIRRTLVFPKPLGVLGAGLRPVAFCAIARPEGFAAMLAEARCGVLETVAFNDHHAMTEDDVLQLLEVARGRNATGFVTTEKDAVKLTAAHRARLGEIGPVMVVELRVEFQDVAGLMGFLEARA